MSELTPTNIKVYDWDSVQEFLCEQIGIEEKYFRRYHEVVGGEYKDFWYVWVDISTVQNDSIQWTYFDGLCDQEEYMIEEYGDWVSPLFRALEELREQLPGDKIYIKYCW